MQQTFCPKSNFVFYCLTWDVLPNSNPVTDIEPPKVILRNTSELEVKPGLLRQSAREQAPLKRFDDEWAAAEVKRWVKYDRKERKTVRFCDGPP